MKWSIMVVCVLMVGLLGSGCAQMGAGIAGSSCPITASDSYTVVGPAKGSSTAIGLFGIQLWPTSTYKALQRAKAKHGSDALVNLRGNNIIYYIPPVFNIISVHKIVIEGDAIKFERGK